MKPEKEIYKNQREVHDKIIDFVKSNLTKDIKEAYLVGSSTTQGFGRYVRKHENHEGSDIDLVVIVEENKIPKNWKYLGVEKDWWKLYRGGSIKINKTIHKADFMVVKPGKESLAHKRMKELGWKPEKIK